MKKWIAFAIIVSCILLFVVCMTTQMINKSEEKWDLIPMVMVNGELYLDTGYTNTEARKCGTPDGVITSAVDRSERPTIDNQSNFGKEYGYQYGVTEGTIEIYMNGQWRIFAIEEVRQQIQFPDRD